MTAKAETAKRDRIYVEKSQIEAYRQLAGIGVKEQGRKRISGDQLPPFKTLKDVFLLAVSLGRRAGLRTPIKPPRQELVFLSYLNNTPDIAILRAIAIAETGDVTIVANIDEVLNIAEEYANTGFEILKRNVLQAGIPLANLAELILEE